MADLHIVGIENHKFVGSGDYCIGILGNKNGPVCKRVKGAQIHQLPDSWLSWEEGPGKSESHFDTQVGGSHYKDLAIQPLEFIVKNNLDFLQGNVVKYVVRYKVKGGLEDLKKAKHYLELMIELTEKNED